MMRSITSSLLGLTLLSGACRLTSESGIMGVLTPGATGRLEFVTTTIAGGNFTMQKQVLDSVHATITTGFCMQSLHSSQSCDAEAGRTTRTISRTELDSIFRVVSSAQFRTVRATYERVGDIVPPDAASVKLDVTVHERSRTITWERNSQPPKILTDLQCLVLTAGGSFGLCAVID